jgi:hypothetical protein
MTKLCKDCKYHIIYGYYDTCTHLELKEPPSPVNGKSPATLCGIGRLGKCGPDAKYFEPKPVRESWYQLIKNIFKK